MSSNQRYQRQVILPELGATGQERLQAARVLCVGAGGLGSPALYYLAAAGIGTIGIADFDCVEESNLQRQILFREKDRGEKKAIIAGQRLQELNSTLSYNIHAERLTSDNILEIIRNYDVIIDGTDNLATKFLINDAGRKLGLPVVYAAILGFEGQLSIFTEHSPCLRCLFPDPGQVVQNCAEAGIVGAVAGMIGSMQALEAVKLCLGNENLPPLTGRLWSCDMRDARVRVLTIPRNPHCAVCSLPKEKIMLTPTKNESCPMTIPSVTVENLGPHQDWQWIDVREQDEWDRGHVPGALLLPLSALRSGSADLSQLPEDKNYLLYCQHGRRSLMAGEILSEARGLNVISLEGGYAHWAASRS